MAWIWENKEKQRQLSYILQASGIGGKRKASMTPRFLASATGWTVTMSTEMKRLEEGQECGKQSMQSAQPRGSRPGAEPLPNECPPDSAPTTAPPPQALLGDRQAVTATATVVDFIWQKNTHGQK